MLIERAEDPLGALVGFHGYAQTAEDMRAELQQIPGADRWTTVSIQALHPFYIRGDSKVVANWMTRQDRNLAIADNIAYVQSAIAQALADLAPGLHVVMVGFSQGAAMAYRAAPHSTRPVAGVVALGGDIPPELKEGASLTWPPVLVGVGDREEWYAGDKFAADLTFLQSRGITHQVVRFDGAHEWTAAFRDEVGRFIASRAGRV